MCVFVSLQPSGRKLNFRMQIYNYYSETPNIFRLFHAYLLKGETYVMATAIIKSDTWLDKSCTITYVSFC